MAVGFGLHGLADAMLTIAVLRDLENTSCEPRNDKLTKL